MVRLTRRIVLQGISKVSIDKRDTLEIDKEFGRITHLHLQRKGITTLRMKNIYETCHFVCKNQISKIEGLDQASNLEVLHLQRNRLRRIENLFNCKKLKKLYLGYNEIETIEGLHTLEKLEELHVEHQRLEHGMSLTFDPKSLSTLCNTLMVLNITSNNITQIEDLAGMEELHTLMAGENNLTDLDSISLVIRTLPNLRVLELENNPVTKRPQFKERIIGFGSNIQLLNGKEISDETRNFIQRFLAVKTARLENAVRKSVTSMQQLCHPQSDSCIHIPKGNLYTDFPSNSPYHDDSCGMSLEEGDSQFDSLSSQKNYGYHQQQQQQQLSASAKPNLPHVETNNSKNGANFCYTFQQFPASAIRRLQPSTRNSLSQMHSYLSNTDIGMKYQSSTPQFILAPPTLNSASSCGSGGGIYTDQDASHSNFERKPSGAGILKKKSKSKPLLSFKKSSNVDTNDSNQEKSVREKLFKNIKLKNQDEIWTPASGGDASDNNKKIQSTTASSPSPSPSSSSANERHDEENKAILKIMKEVSNSKLPYGQCSRQKVVEGMPMPSPALLRLDTLFPQGGNHHGLGNKKELNVIYKKCEINGRSPVAHQRGSHTNMDNITTSNAYYGDNNNTEINNSTADEGTVDDGGDHKLPPFTTSVYEFPPWNHICRKWTTSMMNNDDQMVTFMP